jgi:hypothetical protein
MRAWVSRACKSAITPKRKDKIMSKRWLVQWAYPSAESVWLVRIGFGWIVPYAALELHCVLFGFGCYIMYWWKGGAS